MYFPVPRLRKSVVNAMGSYTVLFVLRIQISLQRCEWLHTQDSMVSLHVPSPGCQLAMCWNDAHVYHRSGAYIIWNCSNVSMILFKTSKCILSIPAIMGKKCPISLFLFTTHLKNLLISTMFTVFLGLEAPKEERFLQKCIMVLLNWKQIQASD